MNIICPGYESCEQKNCLEEGKCIAFPHNKEKKRCNNNKDTCRKKHVCSILGQCVYLHPLVKDQVHIRRELDETDNLKKIILILTKTMPALGLFRGRESYRPERYWEEQK